jgi:hypothetical protein
LTITGILAVITYVSFAALGWTFAGFARRDIER